MRRMFLCAALLAGVAAAQEVRPPSGIDGRAPGKVSPSGWITAVQSAPPPELKAAQQETRFAKLEALILREQIATDQLAKIRADQQALYLETCKAAGIEPDPKVCAIDLNAKTVTRRTETPATK